MKAPETSLNPETSQFPWLSLGGIIVCLMLASISGFAQGTARPDAQEIARETVKHLQDLRYPKQIAEAQPLCTGPGWSVLVHMTADKHEFFRNFKIGQVKPNPHLIDVQLVRDTADGKSIFWVRLLDVDGVWKLNNVKIEKFNGFDVNLWAQYIYRHPGVLEQRLAANTDAGIQRFNEVTTGISHVLDIIIKLRTLSGQKG